MVDDGARSFEESERMLLAAKEAGIRRMVATPHLRHTQFPVDLVQIRASFSRIREMAEAHGIGIKLGYEVYWKTLLEFPEDRWMELCAEGTRNMLLEFSLIEEEPPSGMERLLRRIQEKGIHVVIAHPERYPFVQRDLSWADRWHDMGCRLQLEGACLIRNMERGSRKACRRLFLSNQADFLATDAHRPEHYALFAEGIRWAQKHDPR